MDANRIDGAETGNGGLESDAGDTIGSVAASEPIAGAIDPDAARNLGSESEAGDDFTAAISDTLTGPGTARTGKRKYTKRKQQNAGQEAPLNINGVEKILYSLHAFASIAVPELAIDEGEAKKLAKAIEGVTNEYKVTLDPKVAAYIDLATVCGIIYGPRAVALYMRKKKEAPVQNQPPRPSATVHPIRPQPGPAQPGPAFDPGKIIDGEPLNPTPPRPQPSQAPAGPAFDPGKIIDGTPER